MAEDDTIDADIFLDDVFDKSSSIPGALPPNVRAFWGYLQQLTDDSAAGAHDSFWRLYFNLNFTSFIEFQRRDVVWAKRTDLAQKSTFQGTILWIKEEAHVRFTQISSITRQAGFLQGPMLGGGGGPVSSGPSGFQLAGSVGCGSLACGQGAGSVGCGSLACGQGAGSVGCGSLACGQGAGSVGCGSLACGQGAGSVGCGSLACGQ